MEGGGFRGIRGSTDQAQRQLASVPGAFGWIGTPRASRESNRSATPPGDIYCGAGERQASVPREIEADPPVATLDIGDSCIPSHEKTTDVGAARYSHREARHPFAKKMAKLYDVSVRNRRSKRDQEISTSIRPLHAY